MPGGVGGEGPRGAPLSRLTAIRMAEAKLAVPAGEALPAKTPLRRCSPPPPRIRPYSTLNHPQFQPGNHF